MKKGFTLLEVLGSILILSGLIAMVSQVTFGGFRRLKKSQRIEKITFLLKQKMSDIESEYKNQNILNLPAEEEGSFEEEVGYRWKFETRQLEMPPSLTLLSLKGLPQSEMNLQIMELIKEVLVNTVTELKLTVTYEKHQKPIQYSLVSYFVNYEDVPAYIQNTISSMIPNTGNLENSLPGLGNKGESN